MTNRTSSRGFTLMELLIVTIIIAVIAAFAIPSYEKAMARQKVKRLILTTNLIAGAQEIYKAKNGQYGCPIVCSSLSEINSSLGLNIMPETGVTYTSFGMTDTAADIIVTDGTLFNIHASTAPTLTISCANLSATPVCP